MEAALADKGNYGGQIKGFTIADLTEQHGVTLNIPPFKHDNQFTERELITTRRIASLRIHVERAELKILKYLMIFQTTWLEIFYVCAMLCNFYSPLCNK